MPIAVAVQRGSMVYVYNEKNSQIMSRSGTLHGYTANTVSLRQGNMIYTYNEKGSQVSSCPAR
jgi:hypothetical protein